MAEIVVSALVGVLIEKLVSGALMNFARSEGIESQLNKWKTTLPMIEAVLADAGQKQMKQKAVELWLIELQSLAYDIEDVLDDIATEAMKRKFEESRASTSSSRKLLMIFPSCCTNFTPHKMMYRRKMSPKLDEIMTRLNDLVEQKNSLSLDVNVKVETSDKTDVRFHQTSSVNESKVLGREKDKEALIGQLLLGSEETITNQNVINTVSIVGMGGLGKTTLAQLLYNDQRVKDRFELRGWVCVSDEFDVFNISKQIYQAVGGENKEFANLDLLHVALKEKLSKKRFMVVLDDVWNEDHKKWDLLRSAFDVGARGSKVMVTTRKMKVASVMDCLQPYELEILSEDISLSLFANYALDEQNFDKHKSLVSIARGIVKKCGGLPLALITLGRVLKTKGTKEEWEELLNSEIWDLHDESDILPALKLSYFDLPAHLKQVFAYCSLFPKDYEFEKKKLVLLWMAQGFLPQPLESLGDKYFEELLSRSFFQPGANDESLYTMHDLMNDLAVSVAGEFFFLMDDKKDLNGRIEDFKKFRHFSFISQGGVARYRKFNELHKVRCLRTFLSLSIPWRRFPLQTLKALDTVFLDLLPKLEFLRVLSLSDYSIPEEVPQSISNLKHLRYLNFSNTDIKQIPEQVSELYNLQSLLVRDCRELSSLRVSFAKLINLRHLDLNNTPKLKKMPLGIGGSRSLQTLSKVVIEGGNGFRVSELKGLSDLQGALSIEGLEKVIEPIEAEDANLQQKKGLDDLDMGWSDIFDDSRDPVVEYEVLESLRAPHSNLKKLKITRYGGMKFPNWVGDPSFDHLTNLTLRGCENCTDLPTLGHLSSLRKLCLRSMKEVKSVGFNLLAHGKPFPGNAFPSLESLEVRDMESLEMWSTSGGDETPRSFPSLRVISITDCPKLANVSFGLIPSLKDLTVEDCPEAVFRNIVGVSSSICTLKLRAIEGLKQLDIEVIKHLGALEDLSIRHCDELIYLWESESESEACRFLGSLQKLEVIACLKLESIKGDKEVVTVGSSIMGSLRQVEIFYCDSLASYCCPNSVEKLEITSCSSMTSLSFFKLQEGLPSTSTSSSSNLKILEVSLCDNIKSISQEHLQSLTSLEEMKILQCQSMEASFWPPSLKSLKIGELKKPMSEWGLLNYPPSLVELTLYGKNSGVVSFGIMEHEVHNNTINPAACYLIPPSLTALIIRDFEEVESVTEVLQHLPLLQQLEIWSCWKLRDVPKSTSSLRVHVLNL